MKKTRNLAIALLGAAAMGAPAFGQGMRDRIGDMMMQRHQ
jgi:hypothetical protein